MKPLIEAGKTIAFRYTPLGAPTYPYNVEPIQLATLVYEIERLKDVRGCLVEIGVARGMTTRFIAQHLTAQGLTQDKLYAIDTFSSFTDSDLEYEVKQRGKSRFQVKGFAYNDFDTWARNFSKYHFVSAIQGDCATFDYRSLEPVKLAFLDVDLYLPTKRALPKLYDVLLPGGVILVDDVRRETNYDGAYQAYMEFCAEIGTAPTFIGTKCGCLRK